jgi:ADP-heptose:LPS heptosyltransferase
MILIQPYAQKLRNGMPNAKTYHRWSELIHRLYELDKNVVQIGLDGEEQLTDVFIKQPSLKYIKDLVTGCSIWIAVDSFLPHFARGIKPGVVIWSVSDPNIFGYKDNLNILKSRKYLRGNQFGIWEQQSFIKEAFLPPDDIFYLIKDYYNEHTAGRGEEST